MGIERGKREEKSSMITDILSNPETEREQALVAYIRLLESDALAKLPHRINSGRAMPRAAARALEGRNVALILARALDCTAHLGNVGIDYPALVRDTQKLFDALTLAKVELRDREY